MKVMDHGFGVFVPLFSATSVSEGNDSASEDTSHLICWDPLTLLCLGEITGPYSRLPYVADNLTCLRYKALSCYLFLCACTDPVKWIS